MCICFQQTIEKEGGWGGGWGGIWRWEMKETELSQVRETDALGILEEGCSAVACSGLLVAVYAGQPGREESTL